QQNADEPESQSGSAPHNYSVNSQGDGRNGLYRSGNAHADAFDSGRRARFSGAQPRASRAILRAAAIAANFQTDSDDRWVGQILPNRKVLPRRRSARRPPTGIHAARLGDVVSAARGYFWRD